MERYKQFNFKESDVVKTKNAHEVLDLMDHDWSYSKAVEFVSKKNKVSKEQLEKELEPFI